MQSACLFYYRNVVFTSNHSIARYLSRIADEFKLYGNNILQATEVKTKKPSFAFAILNDISLKFLEAL